jgi:hypothetical protein
VVLYGIRFVCFLSGKKCKEATKMTGVRNVMRILVYFNPCGIFICYTLLFVVRAEENVEDYTQRRTFQKSTLEVPGKQMAEEDIQQLRSAEWRNGTAREGVILYNGKDNKFSYQNYSPLCRITSSYCHQG